MINALASVFGGIKFNNSLLASVNCSVSGQVVDCANFSGGYIFIILFMLIWAAFFIVIIGGMIFWIMMLVHAAKHDIEDRAMWVVIMAITGLIGAIVYYFVVKRKMDLVTEKTAKA